MSTSVFSGYLKKENRTENLGERFDKCMLAGDFSSLRCGNETFTVLFDAYKLL